MFEPALMRLSAFVEKVYGQGYAGPALTFRVEKGAALMSAK
jgi:hypothetical protein